MEIKLLPKSVRETIRSEVNIRSVPKAISQLVYNSLDAKAASIAIRVNLVTFTIQVIDSGVGISKRNLKMIGYRYATSKYYSAEHLEKNPYIFLSRGESLSSIIKLSQSVKITSRCPNSSKTFCKTFENGKSLQTTSVKQRPSQGTTIIIDNFMYNLPVRKKLINQNVCLDEIKSEIEYIALINPNVSFSLRNDTNGEIIFRAYRTKSIFQTAEILYGKDFTRRLKKICYDEGTFTFRGIMSLDSHTQNRIQLVYINDRFVLKTKIHEIINKLISKSKIIKNKGKITDSPVARQKHGAYIVNLKCSYAELDIVDYIEPVIEFKNWAYVEKCIKHAIIEFFKKHDLIEVEETKNNFQNGSPLIASLPKVRTSQKAGVIRGIPMKRKLQDIEKEQVSEYVEQIFTPSANGNDRIRIDYSSGNILPPLKKICTEPLSVLLRRDLNKKTGQSVFPSEAKNKEKQTILPKTKCAEIDSKQMLVEKNKQNLNKSLESKSQYGKSWILNQFLKSTTIYRDDDDLREEQSKFQNTERDNKTYVTCERSFISATKISFTTIEHNKQNTGAENNLFKVPTAPAPKNLKRKVSSRSSSTDMSLILERDRVKTDVMKHQKNYCENKVFLPNNFHLDLFKNIPVRNNMPSDSRNNFSEMFKNIPQFSQIKNYEWTMKAPKKAQFLQSSDFLQPAKKFIRNNPANQPPYCRNPNIFPTRHKTIVYVNSSLKTFYDMKNNLRNLDINSYNNKLRSYIPNVYPHYSTSTKYNYNFEPEISVPIHKFRNNNYQPCIREPNYKNLFWNQIIDNNNTDFYQNRNNIPSPLGSFIPYTTNPNLQKLSKNIQTHKSNFAVQQALNFSHTKNKTAKRSQLSIMPSYNSHAYVKHFCKNKSKNKSKTLPKNSKELENKTENHVHRTNKQNIMQTINMTKDNQVSESTNEKLDAINSLNKKTSDNSVEIRENETRDDSDKVGRTYFDFLPRNTAINNSLVNNDNQNKNVQSEVTSNNTKFAFSYANSSQNKSKGDNHSHVPHLSPFYSLTNSSSKNTFKIFETKSKNNNKSIGYFKLPNDIQPFNTATKINNTTGTSQFKTKSKNSKEMSVVESKDSSAIIFPEISPCSPKKIDKQNEECIRDDMKKSKRKTELDKSKEVPNETNVEGPLIYSSESARSPKTIDNQDNEKIIEAINTKNINDDHSISFMTISSPILGHSYIKKKLNDTQTIKPANKKSVNNSSIFSSISNLIDEKDVTNLIEELDKSILNVTSSNYKENLVKNNQNESKYFESYSIQNQIKKTAEDISGTISGGPVFLEDSANLIQENYRTIDEILLKSPLCNKDMNKTNLGNNNENNTEMNNYETSENILTKTLSQNVEKSDETNQKVTENYENGNKILEWTKLTSELGNYYINSRTGMTCFGTPRSVGGCVITERHAFMPKGMSQIMFDTSTAVTKELTPKSKNNLHQTIANIENDELQTVKWINFLQNKDSKQFFNDLYCNDKKYESEISNLNNYKLPKKITIALENYSFSTDDFKNIKVINQCDDKFIATKIELQGKYNLLVLFDQHAVHERIRLEKLLKDYEEKESRLKSVKCKARIKLSLDGFQVKMLQNHRQNFENWGLFYEIIDKENVVFTQIPLCWQKKDDSNIKNKEYSSIESLLIMLIQEESNWLRNVKRMNVAYPICLQNSIKTEACTTAIKFGDSLSKEQCENLIKDLFLCDLPFNCAHGRPTLHPIVDLNHLSRDDEEEEIYLNKLMK